MIINQSKRNSDDVHINSTLHFQFNLRAAQITEKTENIFLHRLPTLKPLEGDNHYNYFYQSGTQSQKMVNTTTDQVFERQQQHSSSNLPSMVVLGSPSRRPSPAVTSQNGQILLSDLGPNDILLGRGTGPNENKVSC